MSVDYFAEAQAGAERFRDQVINHRAPCVEVRTTVLAPSGVRVACGQTNHSRAVADMFVSGVLTITSVDTDTEVASYQPGEWVEATTYDANLFPQYTILPHHDPRTHR